MKNGVAQLYKDFENQLIQNDMWYTYSQNGDWHEVNVFYNQKSEGMKVSAKTMAEAFEVAFDGLKEM